MKKKKAVSVLLMCMLVLALIGCSKKPKDEQTDVVTPENNIADTEEEVTKEEEPIVEDTKEEVKEEEVKEEEVVIVEKNAKDVIEMEAADILEGVGVEDCSDENGGKSLGGINNDDYIAFNQVNFGAGGFSKITIRAASWYEDGGDIEIHIGSIDGDLVGTCHIPGTGDWSNWETFDFELPDLSTVNGIQDVYMVFKNGGEWLFNLNWFQFAKGPHDAASVIEAEDFVDSFDVVIEGNSDTEGAQGIGGINNGDYTAYNINFGEGGYNKISLRVASWYPEGGDVEFRLGSVDGELIGTCHVDGTGDWSIWNTVTCDVEGFAALTGEQIVYFIYNNGGDWLFNMNWLQFEK